jgi:hypothetical protein
MKLSALLIVAAAVCPSLAAAQDSSVADQLLQTLDHFNATDPLIGDLGAAIEDSRPVLDSALTKPSILSPTAPSRLACRMLKCLFHNYYADAVNHTSYNTLRLKNWRVHPSSPCAAG